MLISDVFHGQFSCLRTCRSKGRSLCWFIRRTLHIQHLDVSSEETNRAVHGGRFNRSKTDRIHQNKMMKWGRSQPDRAWSFNQREKLTARRTCWFIIYCSEADKNNDFLKHYYCHRNHDRTYLIYQPITLLSVDKFNRASAFRKIDNITKLHWDSWKKKQTVASRVRMNGNASADKNSLSFWNRVTGG